MIVRFGDVGVIVDLTVNYFKQNDERCVICPRLNISEFKSSENDLL